MPSRGFSRATGVRSARSVPPNPRAMPVLLRGVSALVAPASGQVATIREQPSPVSELLATIREHLSPVSELVATVSGLAVTIRGLLSTVSSRTVHSGAFQYAREWFGR